MNTMTISANATNLEVLKKDASQTQKKGLPYMMASVVIWSLVLVIQFIDRPIMIKNFYTFMCSCLMMPLAYGFSKVVGANIFKKMVNPIAKLGFLCTMNQNLYILIVMWASSVHPEAMLMLYCMVFGAHLLPFGWIYDNRAYTFISITEAIGAFFVTLFFGNAATAALLVILQIVLCILLYMDIRKG